MKKALITGINGQDGSYLAELLLKKGYEVHGSVRRSTIENAKKMANIWNIKNRIHLHVCSMDSHLSIYKLIASVLPDECYHLAASSFVSYSFEDESTIILTNFNSTHYLLSSIKELVPKCRFYLAGSSEMFGLCEEYPQNENTKFNPRSMYGVSKLSSFYIVKNYREQYGIYACTGITYNHESVRRDYNFVTRKITASVARIYFGLESFIELGNIEAVRDWGYAPEYVEAMWKMLNNSNCIFDYVIATGIPHTVEEVLKIAFETVGLKYWKYVRINKDFFRPGENIPLIGDASRIKKELTWEAKIKFEEVISEMVKYDVKLIGKERNL